MRLSSARSESYSATGIDQSQYECFNQINLVLSDQRIIKRTTNLLHISLHLQGVKLLWEKLRKRWNIFYISFVSSVNKANDASQGRFSFWKKLCLNKKSMENNYLFYTKGHITPPCFAALNILTSMHGKNIAHFFSSNFSVQSPFITYAHILSFSDLVHNHPAQLNKFKKIYLEKSLLHWPQKPFSPCTGVRLDYISVPEEGHSSNPHVLLVWSCFHFVPLFRRQPKLFFSSTISQKLD